MNRRRFLSSSLTTALLAGATRAETVPPGRTAEHLVYTWKGSHFDVGRQHGQALKEEIVAEAAPALKTLTEVRKCSEAQALDWMVAEDEPLYRRLVPSALEEVRGMANGAGLSYAFAFFAAFRDGMSM